MIGTSLHEYVFIRACIFMVRFAPLIEAGILLVLFASGLRRNHIWANVIIGLLSILLLVEALFVVAIYVPFRVRLSNEAIHPEALSPAERNALFDKCIANVPDPERYLRVWFLGADLAEIRRDNVREFLLWAFFDLDASHCLLDDEVEQELAGYVERVERLINRGLQPGRGSAKCLRLTFDAIDTRYRSVLWYGIVALVDFITHCHLIWHGFQYHAESIENTFAVFPFRLQQVFARHRSPIDDLSYWHLPHTSEDELPLLFFHGVGIGLWTYSTFLAEVNRYRQSHHGRIGIIAVEILPISFRLAHLPFDKRSLLQRIARILDHHGWDQFVLSSHSYGSIVTTHLLHSQEMHARIPAVVLTDPVTALLHLPDVAYNFTRRQPRRANEWQLWYFACKDPAVAHCLGRHFFWKENIIWREDLLAYRRGGEDGSSSDAPQLNRKVAVSLAGRDLIVDSPTVAAYLAGQASHLHIEAAPDAEGNWSSEGGDIEIMWFAKLDHAQLFDAKRNRERVLTVIRSYCQRRRL
jgi:pimeloyl-ACP methyl ester carboxylesterase